MKQSLIRSGLIIAFFFPVLVFASPILRSGDSVSVEADQVLDTDFYGLGSDISVSGEAKQDVYLAGGSVTVNAPVGGDLVILGGTVQIHSPVAGAVRVVGGEVVLASKVDGDVVVLGGVLKVLSTAEISGDLLYFGGQLDVSGPVDGSILAKADSIRIDAAVGHDVSVSVTKELSLGDRSNIQGNLTYKSVKDLARAQKAIVAGNLRKEDLLQGTSGANPLGLLLPLFVILFAVFTILMLFRPRVQELTQNVQSSYGTLGLLGLGVFLGIPFVAAVLMASVIGAIVGVILLLSYIILITISLAISGMVFGSILLKPITHSNTVTLVTAFVGTLCFMLLALIPFIGPLIAISGFIIVLGGISKELYQSFR